VAGAQIWGRKALRRTPRSEIERTTTYILIVEFSDSLAETWPRNGSDLVDHEARSAEKIVAILTKLL
jgi:hypothetical protein